VKVDGQPTLIIDVCNKTKVVAVDSEDEDADK